MKRFGAGLLAAVALLMLALLFGNVHVGHTSAQTRSQQSVSTTKAGPARVGSELRVYVRGDRALAGALQRQLKRELQAKELPFAQVNFVDDIPTDANANPFLAILVEQDEGQWTPLYATRHVKATMRYVQGSPVILARVLAPGHATIGVPFSDGTCTAECAAGQLGVEWTATARGLIGLSHLRSEAAGKLAEKAATLVADGLPENLNPAKWSKRASDLAPGQLGAQPGGVRVSSFRRLAGCQGGILSAGGFGPGASWSLMYYDAGRDAITEVLTRSQLQARLPGTQMVDPPYFVAIDNVFAVYLGGKPFPIAPGVCSLSGWPAGLSDKSGPAPQ